MQMPFGKYKGVAIADVPTRYLRWLLDNVDFYDEDLPLEIDAELDRRGRTTRQPPPPPPPPPSHSIIPKVKAWYREMAMRFHPDRTGDDGRAMLTINAAYERLVEILDLPR